MAWLTRAQNLTRLHIITCLSMHVRFNRPSPGTRGLLLLSLTAEPLPPARLHCPLSSSFATFPQRQLPLGPILPYPRGDSNNLFSFSFTSIKATLPWAFSRRTPLTIPQCLSGALSTVLARPRPSPGSGQPIEYEVSRDSCR